MINMKRTFSMYRLLLCTPFALLLWSLGVANVFAADVVLAPSTGSYGVGQTFTAAVRVQPAGANVNAVEAALKFDPKVLSVVSISKDGSAFSLWTTEPAFSNSAGTVTFGGGSPTPFTAASTLVTITFRTVSEGTAAVTFSNASVLAADGRGTDVFKNSTPGSFTIAAASTPPPSTPTTPTTPTTQPEAEEESEEAIIVGDPPRAPEAGSQVFLDPEVWYKETDGLFTWQVPFDVTAVAIEIATSVENVPSKNKNAIYDPPVDDFIINKGLVTDGEQYFSIQYQNQVGWGAVLNRKLRIDTTPPEAFTIDVGPSNSSTGFPLLTFEAVDVTSGIEYYEMTVHDKEPFKITPDQAKIGYLLNELEDGTYTVKVDAYDKAGNKREGSVAVLITAGWLKPVEEVETTSMWDYLTALNLFIVFLLVVIILQFVYLWYDKKSAKLKEEKLRKETREIQDQMEKIFSALRDEIYDQINTITKNKRLSKNERIAVEGLTQALEVSETLIEKEISDVKSILK
jgi:Cohesin domain